MLTIFCLSNLQYQSIVCKHNAILQIACFEVRKLGLDNWRVHLCVMLQQLKRLENRLFKDFDI
jgi:hypothetical protein